MEKVGYLSRNLDENELVCSVPSLFKGFTYLAVGPREQVLVGLEGREAHRHLGHDAHVHRRQALQVMADA